MKRKERHRGGAGTDQVQIKSFNWAQRGGRGRKDPRLPESQKKETRELHYWGGRNQCQKPKELGDKEIIPMWGESKKFSHPWGSNHRGREKRDVTKKGSSVHI